MDKFKQLIQIINLPPLLLVIVTKKIILMHPAAWVLLNFHYCPVKFKQSRLRLNVVKCSVSSLIFRFEKESGF